MNESFNRKEKEEKLITLMNFIKEDPNFPVTLDIGLDSYSSQLPSFSIDTIEGGKKKGNIIGGYEAEIPFNLSIKLATNDSTNRVDAIKVLNDLGTFFDEKTQKKEMPDLGEKEACTMIEMIGVPHLRQRKEETESDIYQASYMMKTKYKSQIE